MEKKTEKLANEEISKFKTLKNCIQAIVCSPSEGFEYTVKSQNVKKLDINGNLLSDFPTENCFHSDISYDENLQASMVNIPLTSMSQGIVCDRFSQKVFCGSSNGTIYCFGYDGKISWTIEIGGWITGIAVDSQRKQLFCCSTNGHLHCIDYQGANKWTYQENGWMTGLSFNKDQICLETLEISFCNGGILPENFLKGSGSVKNKHSKKIYSINLGIGLIARDQSDYRLGTNSFFERADNFLYCFTSNSNQEDLWEFATDGFVFGHATDIEKGLVFCGFSEKIFLDSEINKDVVEGGG